MPQHAAPPSRIALHFDPASLLIGDTDLRTGLSAIALDGDTLWVACDEGCRLERLRRSDDGASFARHRAMPLHDFLPLPAPDTDEADIEGMDVANGWLWIVGSHSVKRRTPRDDAPQADIAKRLAKTGRDGNRYLLARIPLSGGTAYHALGDFRAQAIEAGPTSSALTKAIGRRRDPDPHLAPFLEIPGKDNGFDVEGLAVSGDRVFVGLRGPVLRGWACVLELRPAGDGRKLRLDAVHDGRPYRKHFLNLDGLGVRDLLVLERDILILAGPTLAHDGPCEIWRWKDAAAGPSEAPVRLLTLPTRSGADRAEGFTELPDGSLLVVYDAPAPERLVYPATVLADVVRL